MSGRLHLHLECGRYHLAVDAARVSELRPGDASHDGLAVIDLREVLDVAADGGRAELLMEDGATVLAVDRVAGMVRAEDADFAPLPPALRHATRLFDAVLVSAVDGSRLLRLAAGQPDPDFFRPKAES